MRKVIAFCTTLAVVMVLLTAMTGTMALAAQDQGPGNADQKAGNQVIAEKVRSAIRGQLLGEALNPECPCGLGAQADYPACPVEGCTVLGVHEHDGVLYRCALFGTECPNDGIGGFRGGLGAGGTGGAGAGGVGGGMGYRGGRGPGNACGLGGGSGISL